MRKIFSSLVFLCFLSTVFSQNASQRSILAFEQHQLNQTELKLGDSEFEYKCVATGEIPLKKITPFLAYSLVIFTENWDAESHKLAVWFYDEKKQIPATYIQMDEHATAENGRFISQLYFTASHVEKIHFRYRGSSKIKRIEVHFYNPGATPPVSEVNPIQDRFACSCPPPSYLDRKGWCPNGTCPEDATPVITDVTHLIVHHSAGSNVSSDWSAVVRSIWDYHVNVNGWDDIGYNWLVDPKGVLYQGRGNNHRGAHFCGNNGGTMGVCVMGDFSDVEPRGMALQTLTELLSWKSCEADLEPGATAFHPTSGQNLRTISGHRDGCSTQCPGNLFYPMLEDIRLAVDVRFNDADCAGNYIVPPIALMGEITSPTEIRLTWQDASQLETGFILERSHPDNQQFMVLANLPANTTSYSDAQVVPGTDYYYRVKATGDGVSSLYSNEVKVSPEGNGTVSMKLDETTVTIYPNPVSSVLKVVIRNGWLGNTRIRIWNAEGKETKAKGFFVKEETEFMWELNMEQYPAGVYFMEIRQGGTTGVFEVVR